MKELRFTNLPIVIENNNFDTIDFVIMFPYKNEFKHIFDLLLIKQLVTNTSLEFKTELEFKKEILKNMIINYSVRTIKYNKNLYLEFDLTVPSPKRVKSFSLQKAIDFFINNIYKPNIQDKGFNQYQFNREKDYIDRKIKNNNKQIYRYSYQQFIDICDENGILKNNIYNNLDLLEKTNSKDLYAYYKKLVINNEPLCYVYGDITEEELNKLNNPFFKKEKKDIIIKKDYYLPLIPKKEVKVVEEVKDYNQSALYMAYKVENMTEEDKYLLSLLVNILDCPENDLIFKALRIDNNLVYGSYVNSHMKNGLFYIEAYLNKTSKDKAIEAIKNVLESLKDKNKVETYINKLLVGIKYDLIRKKDSKYAKLSDYINKSLEFTYSLEDLYDAYLKITPLDFVNFLNRVKLDTIYFLRGENND